MTIEKSTILKTIEEVFLDTFPDGGYEFSLDTDSNDIEEWDSLSHIRLLTAVESEYGFQFDIDEIEQLSSVAAIVDLVTQKTS